MKLFGVVLLSLFYFTLLCQNIKTDRIVWNESKRLTWDDYTKIAPKKGLHGWAATTFAFSKRDTCVNGQIQWTIASVFSKSRSWVFKTKLDDKDLLEHELLHFDLLEVYVRLCRKEISSMDKTCSLENEDKIALLIAKYEKLHMAENLKYDKESNHYFNKLKQKEWSDRVKKQLEELKEYK